MYGRLRRVKATSRTLSQIRLRLTLVPLVVDILRPTRNSLQVAPSPSLSRSHQQRSHSHSSSSSNNNSSNSSNSPPHLHSTRWTVGRTWEGCSCHCNRIITRRTLVARSRAAEAQWGRPHKQSHLLSMTLPLPNRRTLRRNVIHSLEIRRLVGVARRQVVVRTWRRTEEAAESSFGRVERRSVVHCHCDWVDLVLPTYFTSTNEHLFHLPVQISLSFLPSHSSFFSVPNTCT